MVTNLAQSILNILTDLVMLTVPMRPVWNVQLSLQKKLGLSALF